MKRNIHILTFASENYIRAARLQKSTSLLLGFKHTLFTERNLPSEILEFARSHPRGFGFWMWKSYLIERMLHSSHIDDIYWWLDSSILPSRALKDIEFSTIYISENIFSNPLEWSKPIPNELLNNYSSFLQNGYLPDASYIGIKPSFFTLKLVSFWSRLCSNPYFVDDDLHGIQPSPRFRDHRHDQSMLGYTVYVFNITLYPSITQYGIGPLSLFHHRKSGSSLFSCLYVLLLCFIALLAPILRIRQNPITRLPKSLLYSKYILPSTYYK